MTELERTEYERAYSAAKMAAEAPARVVEEGRPMSGREGGEEAPARLRGHSPEMAQFNRGRVWDRASTRVGAGRCRHAALEARSWAACTTASALFSISWTGTLPSSAPAGRFRSRNTAPPAVGPG